MRYALECPVESVMRLAADFEANWFGKLLTIKRNESGIVSLIRIEGQVAPSDTIRQVFVEDPSGVLGLTSEGGVEIHGQLQQDLQAIESALAFHFNLSRIRWEAATSVAVPETNEERAEIEFNNFTLRRATEKPMDVKNEDLVSVLQSAHGCRELATVLAFFREGQNDLSTQRYITAFYSFYFVLEGLYSNGHTRNRLVKAEYLKAQSLVECVRQLVDAGPPPKPRLSFIYSIEDLLTQTKQVFNVEGVITMFVLMRGNLHHFVNAPTRPSGTPFTHERYETLALYAMTLCRLVLLKEMRDCLERVDPN